MISLEKTWKVEPSEALQKLKASSSPVRKYFRFSFFHNLIYKLAQKSLLVCMYLILSGIITSSV